MPAKQAILATIVAAAGLQIAPAGELTALPEEEIPNALAISGFHSAQDNANKLEIRILEGEDSNVAKNPVALFVVVTDNASSDDSQTHIWRLAEGVSEVKGIRLTNNGARIAAVVDGQMNEKTGRFPTENQVINISYDFAKGVLSDKLKVSTAKP